MAKRGAFHLAERVPLLGLFGKRQPKGDIEWFAPEPPAAKPKRARKLKQKRSS